MGKPPRAEFTTYADLLETMCTSPPNAATQRQRSPTSRRHSSVVLPTSSSLLMREESKPSRPKRFSTSGSGSFLSSSACPVVKEEEPACETYSCDQLVINAKSLSCNSLDSASSHSPPSSPSSSLSSSDSMADLGSEQSTSESELMSDPSSCDELWLLPQQVLATFQKQHRRSAPRGFALCSSFTQQVNFLDVQRCPGKTSLMLTTININ